MWNLSKKRLLIYLCFCILLVNSITGTYATEKGPSITGIANFSESYKVFNEVNKLRRSIGVKELIMDQSLQNMAMQRAAECSVFYSHTRPNTKNCFSIYDEFNYSCGYMGENIAIGYETAEGVYNAWKNSSGHYENMTSNNYSAIGIGCFYQEDGTKTWIQLFSDSDVTNYRKQSIDKKNFDLFLSERLISTVPELTQTMNKGEKLLLDTRMTNQTFPYTSFQLDQSSFIYKSSHTTIASVDANGLVTALKSGSANIKATLKGTSLTREFKVLVILPSTPFIDVNETAWYSETVKQVYNLGFIKGTDGTHFSPNEIMSRGMLSTILWRMEGAPSVSNGKNFPDVSSNDYFYNAIKWATSKGIVSGYSSDLFGPNDKITREQLTVMLRNYAQYKGKSTSSNTNLGSFSDAKSISEYAKSAMSWAVMNKIVSGKNNGTTLDPIGTATRAEAAAMIYNYYYNIK